MTINITFVWMQHRLLKAVLKSAGETCLHSLDSICPSKYIQHWRFSYFTAKSGGRGRQGGEGGRKVDRKTCEILQCCSTAERSIFTCCTAELAIVAIIRSKAKLLDHAIKLHEGKGQVFPIPLVSEFTYNNYGVNLAPSQLLWISPERYRAK